MFKYTINNKDHSIHDINVACAEMMGLKVSTEQYLYFGDRDENVVLIGRARDSYGVDYCNNPSDTWPIIEKVFDRLNKFANCAESRWQYIMNTHNCTKLVAACICFIEENS